MATSRTVYVADVTVDVLVLGAGTDNGRTFDSQKLLNYGLQFFQDVKLYGAGQQVTSLRVYKGSSSEMGVGFLHDFYVTVPRGAGKYIQARAVTRQPMLAPVTRGQDAGTLHLTLGGKPLGSYTLRALSNDRVAGPLKRTDCSLVSDGAAAVVLADIETALKFDKADLKRRIDKLRGFAKTAGRSPEAVEISGQSFVLAADSKAESDAMVRATAQAMSIEDIEATRHSPQVLVGTADEVKRELRWRIEELGITYFSLEFLSREKIEWFAERIIPEFTGA